MTRAVDKFPFLDQLLDQAFEQLSIVGIEVKSPRDDTRFGRNVFVRLNVIQKPLLQRNFTHDAIASSGCCATDGVYYRLMGS